MEAGKETTIPCRSLTPSQGSTVLGRPAEPHLPTMTPLIRFYPFQTLVFLVVFLGASRLLPGEASTASETSSARPGDGDLSDFARYLPAHPPDPLASKALTSAELYAGLRDAFRTRSLEQSGSLLGKNVTDQLCELETDEFSAALHDVQLLLKMPLSRNTETAHETNEQSPPVAPAAPSSCVGQEFVAKTVNASLLNGEVLKLLATVADAKQAGHRAFQVGSFLDYIRQVGAVNRPLPGLVSALVEHLARLHEDGERTMKRLISSIRTAARVIEKDWDVADQITDRRQKEEVLEFLSFYGRWAELSLQAQQARWSAIKWLYLSLKPSRAGVSADGSQVLSAASHASPQDSPTTLELIYQAETAGFRDLDMAERVTVRARTIASQGLMPLVFGNALLGN